MGALKGAGGDDVIRTVPRDLHLEQQLRLEWVDRRGPWDGLPISLKGPFNKCISAGMK